MTFGGHVGRGSHILLLRGPCAALSVRGRSIDLKVEALSRWIVIISIRVGVAEAIVACLKEAHEGL